MVLTNLCTAGIAPGCGGARHTGFHILFPSMQVVLVFMGLDVGSRAFCLVNMSTEVSHLDLGWLPSDPITSLAPGSSFSLTDCESLLIILTIGLIFMSGLVAAYGLVTTDVAN